MSYFPIASSAVLACTLLTMGDASAENAEREKCTCDTYREGELNNGAWVKNATACWSTEDRGRQWCDITVQSLEGGSVTGAVADTLFQKQTDSSALIGVFQEQFVKFVSSYTSSAHTVPLDIGRASAEVPALLKKNESRISTCVVAFKDATFGKGGIEDEDDNFRCSVGEATGWLRVEFRAGDVWLAYMLAPNG